MSKGDCFVVAYRLITEPASSDIIKFLSQSYTPRLAHGWPIGRGKIAGYRFPHAWAEYGPVVVDFSNDLNVVLPREVYYQLGNLTYDEVIHYNAEEAKLAALTSGTYGPWEF
jgi:hypothetical protein